MINERIKNTLEQKGWTLRQMIEHELDLAKERAIDLARNQVAVITDLNLIIEVSIPGNALINPINALKNGQIVIAGILYESFEVNLIHQIENKLFTYQLKVKAQPMIQSSTKIEGNLLDDFMQSGLVRKLVSGYALFTTISKQ